MALNPDSDDQYELLPLFEETIPAGGVLSREYVMDLETPLPLMKKDVYIAREQDGIMSTVLDRVVIRQSLKQVTNGYNWNALEGAQGQQVLIARNNQIGLALYRARQDYFIIRVVRHAARHVKSALYNYGISHQQAYQFAYFLIGHAILSSDARVLQRGGELRHDCGRRDELEAMDTPGSHRLSR